MPTVDARIGTKGFLQTANHERTLSLLSRHSCPEEMGALRHLRRAQHDATGLNLPIPRTSGRILDFEALAQKVGLTYRSFRYLFTKESGLSPLQYQLERRLARAKNLLASSDMPVKDIAETLGFNSSWYFAHFFRKHMNCSPATYRNRTHSVQ